MSERKLKAWQSAGLIDAATVARITAWEAERARPMGLWALVALGALAIGLGLMSLIAANWDAIPGTVRLAVHAAALLAIGVVLGRRAQQTIAPDHDEDAGTLFDDALLFVFGALGITFLGHVGQVYQTSAPLWQPLALWLILFSPVFLGFGRGWLAACGWLAALFGTALAHAAWYLDGMTVAPTLYLTAQWGLPAVVVASGSLIRAHSSRVWFWRALVYGAMMLLVAGASGVQVVTGFVGGMGPSALRIGVLAGLVTLVAALVTRHARQGASGMAALAVMAAAAGTTLAALVLPDTPLWAALTFMALWLVVGWAALQVDWRGLFQLATAVLALRLIILSFELATDLLGSGLGLILAGLLTLAIAWGAVRVSRRLAPVAGGAA